MATKPSLAGLPSGKSSRLPRGYSKWSRPRRSKYWADKRTARKNLLNPQKQLSGTNLLGAARAEVDLENTPKISALDTQARSARIQGGAVASRAGGYYGNIAAEAQADVGRIQALHKAVAGRIQDVNAQGMQALDAAQHVADTAQARDTAVRGPGLSGGGDANVREELAAARARSAESGQAAATTGENIGANWEGFARQMATAQQMHGGEIQSQLLNKLANELSDIRTKKADIQSLSGEQLTSNLMKLRQQAFENSATASTLGQKKLALQYQQEADQADRALAKARMEETASHNSALEDLAGKRIDATLTGQNLSHQDRVAGQNLSHADRVAARKLREKEAKLKAKGKGAKEPQSSLTAKSKIIDARARIAELLKTPITKGDKKGKLPSFPDIQPYLRQEGYSPLVQAAAYDMHRFGFLTPATERRLRTAGIRVPPGWNKTPAHPRRTGFGPH